VIFTTPAFTPVINPVDELAVAVVALLLLHVPPVRELVSVIVSPAHTTSGPLLLPGVGFTVIVFVAVHAPPNP
jgi:hypothetical protein